MPAEVELTLKQLAQIALGAPELTKVHVTILHALMDMLLKKLNCSDEKVSLGGFEARCLLQILGESKICPLPFNDEQMALMAHKVERLERLEVRVSELDKQLSQHFDQIRECNKVELLERQFALPLWEHYTNKCEDMCTLCDNEIACSLLGNCDFLKKLMRRISGPIVERIFQFEQKIETLQTELQKFLARAEEQFDKIKLIEGCIIELELMRHHQREHELRFLGTMEEVQDMLDAKLEKLHLPPLKKYVQDYFARLEERLNMIETQKTCGKAAGVVMDLRCLSCGAERVCAERGVHATGMLPDMQPPRQCRSKEPPSDRFCGCQPDGPGGGLPGITLIDRMNTLNLKAIENQLLSKKRRSCRAPSARFQQIIGSDGNIYRGDG